MSSEDISTTEETATITTPTKASGGSNASTPILKDSIYSSLRWIATLFIPAFGALYAGLADIWALPYGIEVVGTCSLLTVFASTLLKISEKQYNTYVAENNSGQLTIDPSITDEESTGYSIQLAKNLTDYQSGDVIRLHVA